MSYISGVTTAVTLDAGELSPSFNLSFGENRHSIRLANDRGMSYVDLDGTLDELAKFVQDLANVVREINARELVG